MSNNHKLLTCKVILLDDTSPSFSISRKAFGEELYSQVFKSLQLLESDYFGLEFRSNGQRDIWLDKDKPILHQIGREDDLSFKFKVKFYTPDPNLLEDEFTRYLFALQVKQDLATGRLMCNANTTAILSAYIAQSELGDYNEEDMPNHSYLKCISFVPNQTDELEQCVMQYHRGFGGMNPSDADFKLLDTGRKTDYYGIVQHLARDHEGVTLHLAVTETGIFVYQNSQRINTFSWAKIRKLSFKRKRFLIKLHPAADQAYYKNTVEFFFTDRDEAKAFWKLAIEHHSFFRCREVQTLKRHRRTVITRGSSFRYTGRTQKQLLDHVKENYVRGRTFERTLSARHTLSGTRSFGASRSTTLNSRREFNPDTSTLSSGSHLIGGSDSQHSGLKTPSSHQGERTPTHSPQRDKQAQVLSPPILRPASPPGRMDRNASMPVMTSAMNGPSMDQQKLSRTPDYTNIPEKVESPPDQLTRSESVSDIPQEVRDDVHSEPKELLPSYDQMCPSAPSLIRVHSETDTLGNHNNVERITLNNTSVSSDAPSEPVVNGNHTPNAAEMEPRKNKKAHVDGAYFIAKELLMTERTYQKDLSIIVKSFREYVKDDDVSKAPLSRLYSMLDPICEQQTQFTESLERRLAQADSKIMDNLTVTVGDLVMEHFHHLHLYKDYLSNLEELLTELLETAEASEMFGKLIREFEMEKICYLSIYSLLLKPAHRLLHYEIILSRLVAQAALASTDYNESKQSLSSVTECLSSLRSVIAELENTEKLIELQEDIGGMDGLVHQGRYFIREGCLQKLSRRGYQQRLFLLLSDVLLYTSRAQSSSLHFKVHGHMPLAGMSLEESDPNVGVANGFTIYGANRCLIVAANTQEEKDKWIEDLNFAISIANSDQIEMAEMPLPSITPPANGGGEDLDESQSSSVSSDKPQQQTQHRSNTTMHVCWHRSTSVSIKDIQNAIKHQLSGYLLRKFKNSNGWQKLWVVFTNFCLFFYKTYQDDFPLASLPLLGYSVSKPSASDGIHKDYVFKLQFKNHVYFFRAESQYTYDRWIEVINSATQSARRNRLFSRMDSMA